MTDAAAGAVGIKEATMRTAIPSLVGFAKTPWNKGRIIGQKRPLKPKEVWAIRVRLQLEQRRRDLALFNLAIDSKLRGYRPRALDKQKLARSAIIRPRTEAANPPEPEFCQSQRQLPFEFPSTAYRARRQRV